MELPCGCPCGRVIWSSIGVVGAAVNCCVDKPDGDDAALGGWSHSGAHDCPFPVTKLCCCGDWSFHGFPAPLPEVLCCIVDVGQVLVEK